MSGKDRQLVYSTDPKDQAIISGEAERQRLKQQQSQLVDHNKFTVVFRLETQSRGGKTVTVLDKLPAHETFIKELTRELKTRCGTGGSSHVANGYGVIEIQGDKREPIKKILDNKKIKYKGM